MPAQTTTSKPVNDTRGIIKTTNSYYAAFLSSKGLPYTFRWMDQRSIEFSFSKTVDDDEISEWEREYAEMRGYINAHQDIMKIVKREIDRKKGKSA